MATLGRSAEPIHTLARPFPTRSLYPEYSAHNDSGNDQNEIPGFNRSAPAGKIVNHEDFRND